MMGDIPRKVVLLNQQMHGIQSPDPLLATFFEPHDRSQISVENDHIDNKKNGKNEVLKRDSNDLTHQKNFSNFPYTDKSLESKKSRNSLSTSRMLKKSRKIAE
jgi:hypothetical protein